MTEPMRTELGERFERAATHAVASARARRDALGAPAIAHVFSVCAIVVASGATESAAIAALLHDLPPGEFGADVTRLVRWCDGMGTGAPSDTGDGGASSWYDQRRAFLARVAALGEDDHARSARFIGAAIALARARTMRDALASDPDAFGRVPGKKFGTLWYLRALVDAYAGDGRHERFTAEVSDIVTGLAGKAVTVKELLAAFVIDDTVHRDVKGSLDATVASR
ncbi:MAG: hypothetical protein NVS4B5_06300 [Vulcanimicrobiaceae bacterium]